jgi:crotonobetainyl-CoA:carnitine CoA-transferase CaiB-like acyl-CoA transferase
MGTMDGVKVIEVASWTFVPSAGAVLADWGADVIKVEHPETGDPQRALMTSGLLGPDSDIVNFMIEQPNRGKRSFGVDIGTAQGRALLYKLVEDADVFLTNFLKPALQRLEIDVEHIRAVNPDIIYARGTGQGPKGPESDRGGYDAASFWSRGAIADSLTAPGEYPVMQTAGFGDLIGGQNIAGGIAAALFKRERTGEPSIVDISLLSTAMWIQSFGVVASDVIGFELKTGGGDRSATPNPLVGTYKTADDRFVMLVFLQSDRYWEEFCRAVDRVDLIDDPRYRDAKARDANKAECIAELDRVFASRTLEDWKKALADIEGVWAPVQSQKELLVDPQALANSYAVPVTNGQGQSFKLVPNPVQFDEVPPALAGAPEHGQHTEEILLDLGLSWEDIASHKTSGAII